MPKVTLDSLMYTKQGGGFYVSHQESRWAGDAIETHEVASPELCDDCLVQAREFAKSVREQWEAMVQWQYAMVKGAS